MNITHYDTKMKTIVLIGGGSATGNLLRGLRQFPTNNIVIVSTADDGGSTGILRRDLGVMPWGDIRQCLIALAYTAPALKKLFSYRFAEGALKRHSAGNIILAALEKVTGSPEGAIAEAARLLNVRGEVLFVSQKPTTLSARLTDGTKIGSEHEIDEPLAQRRTMIEELTLSPATASPRAIAAIARADAIILGPGDLYTSSFPNLLVPKIAETIRASRAQKILITNIMTKRGQTEGFSASDFLRETNRYLGGSKNKSMIETVIVNTKKPKHALLVRYKKEEAEFVAPDLAARAPRGVRVIALPLIADRVVRRARGDALTRSFIRHNAEKTAEIIWNLVQ